MAKYNLYAGMSGGFGGVHFCGTYEYTTLQEAEKAAAQFAIEEYQGYEGYHGILSWEDCREDLIDSFGEIPTDEEVDSHYYDQIESWVTYYAEPYDEENPPEEE